MTYASTEQFSNVSLDIPYEIQVQVQASKANRKYKNRVRRRKEARKLAAVAIRKKRAAACYADSLG